VWGLEAVGLIWRWGRNRWEKPGQATGQRKGGRVPEVHVPAAAEGDQADDLGMGVLCPVFPGACG